jgi:hypothetical protein
MQVMNAELACLTGKALIQKHLALNQLIFIDKLINCE